MSSWIRVFDKTNTQFYIQSIIFIPNIINVKCNCNINSSNYNNSNNNVNKNCKKKNNIYDDDINIFYWIPPRIKVSENFQNYRNEISLTSSIEKYNSIKLIDIYDNDIINIINGISNILFCTANCRNSLTFLSILKFYNYKNTNVLNMILELLKINKKIRDSFFDTYKNFSKCENIHKIELITFIEMEEEWNKTLDEFTLKKFNESKDTYLQQLYSISYLLYVWFSEYEKLLLEKINAINKKNSYNELKLYKFLINEYNRVIFFKIYEYLRLYEIFKEINKSKGIIVCKEIINLEDIKEILEYFYKLLKMNDNRYDIDRVKNTENLIRFIVDKNITKNQTNKEEDKLSINSINLFNLIVNNNNNNNNANNNIIWNLFLTNPNESYDNIDNIDENSQYLYLYNISKNLNNNEEYYTSLINEIENLLLSMLDSYFNNSNYNGSISILKNRLIHNINRINNSINISDICKENFSDYIERRNIQNLSDILDILKESDNILKKYIN